MKKALAVSVALLSLGVFASAACADVKKGEKMSGQAEFNKHCVACHPKGGNIINPGKTLSKKSMQANGVRTTKDIIAKMRNPGPGMTKFDAKTVPDSEAKAIAEYIQKTYK